MSPARKPTAAEIAAAPPDAGGTTTTGPKPLGVPEGYTASKTVGKEAGLRFDTFNALDAKGAPVDTQRYGVAPRYFDGDEWAPASMSAEDRARLQRAMVDAGVIAKGTKFRLGIWDDATRNAYADLLGFANGAGLDVKEALSQYQQMQESFDQEERATRQPLTVRLTNPDDLRESFEVVARRKIGRKLRPEESERFVRAYQAEEANVQRQDYGMAEAGGTFTAAADPQSFMAAKLAKEYGVEAGAHDIAEQGGSFFELLDEVGG